MKTYQLRALSGRAPATPVARMTGAAVCHRAETAPRFTFKPLSKTQKAVLCILAGNAWQAELRRGNIAVSANLVKSQQFEDWRHEQQVAACGVGSLRACTQEHYLRLRAHFNNLIGTPAATARSFRDTMQTGPVNDTAAAGDTHEARNLWRNKLGEALTEFNLQPGYAAAICRTKYKCDPANATAHQLRCLTFDIRRNGQSRRRKAQSSTNPF